MIISHEYFKVAYLDFVSSSFCDMRTVMFLKWGQFLSLGKDDICHYSGYEFSCV